MASTYSERYFGKVAEIASALDYDAVDRIAIGLAKLRAEAGRLFVIGVGGSAGNSCHAVDDFRKLTGIDASAPTDNASELTARTNDEGWETVFEGSLQVSNAGPKDAVLVLSVGGGDPVRGISANIVRGLDEAKKRGMTIYGFVGRDGGYTKKVGDEVIVVPTLDPEHVTPLSESFQALIWHCLVFHPSLKLHSGKWESVDQVQEKV